MSVTISIIAAIDANRGLGKNNRLLFKILEDMKRFKKLTTGHVVVMGRKTFESIGRSLPKRTNIVVTRDAKYKAGGCIVVHSLDEALEKATEIEKEEIFVIGGGEIYNQAIEIADTLYLTIVKGSYEADAFFPECESKFHEISRTESRDNNYSYAFTVWERD